MDQASTRRKVQGVEDRDGRLAVALSECIAGDVDIILKVAGKSKTLKGTCQRTLKEAATSIRSAVDILCSRSASEEFRKMQAENKRLRLEMEDLRKEMVKVKDHISRYRKSDKDRKEKDRQKEKERRKNKDVLRRI